MNDLERMVSNLVWSAVEKKKVTPEIAVLAQACATWELASQVEAIGKVLGVGTQGAFLDCMLKDCIGTPLEQISESLDKLAEVDRGV